MNTITQGIPTQHWARWLDDVTELYQGWRATVETLRMDLGDQPAIGGLPLLEIRLEEFGPHSGDILITAGDPARERVRVHHIIRPVGISVAMTEPGAEADLQVESEDGTVTLITLRRRAALPSPQPHAPARSQRRRATQPPRWSLGTPTDAPEQRRRDDDRYATPVRDPLFEEPEARRTRTPTPAARTAGHDAWDAQRRPADPSDARTGDARFGEARFPAAAIAIPPPALWPILVLRGAAAAAFGLFSLLMPRMALLTFILLFGAFALADGFFNLIAAFRAAQRPGQQPRWLLITMGVAGIAAGLCALLIPGVTAVALLYVIAAWAIAVGVAELIAGVQLRGRLSGVWLLAIGGILSIAAGVLLALFPGAGALALVIWIGAFALALGVLLIIQGLSLRHQLTTARAWPGT